MPTGLAAPGCAASRTPGRSEGTPRHSAPVPARKQEEDTVGTCPTRPRTERGWKVHCAHTTIQIQEAGVGSLFTTSLTLGS